MVTRPAGSLTRFRRGGAIAAGLLAIGGLAVFTSAAGASPQPTVAQVQAKVNQLTTQYDQVSQQLDQAGEQLSGAQTRLNQVHAAVSHANAQFQAEQTTVAQMAAATFEDTGATSMAGVLTSANPSAILQQGSLLMELSGSRNAETAQLLTDASQLTGVEQELQRTEDGITSLRTQLTDHKNSLGKLIATEHATLDSLTVPQQQQVQANSLGGTSGTSGTSGTANRHVQRPDLEPGGQGGRVRLRPARLSLRLRRDRAVLVGLRLLRPGSGRVGVGRRGHSPRQLRAVGWAPARRPLRCRAGRPADLRR